MEDLTSWTSVLGDAGMAGAFILFLVWQHREQSRRLDSYVNRLLETLATIEKEREEGYEIIRSRYDTIIDRYNTERDTLLLNISTKLDHVSDRLNQ
tara:strand:+ start:186 stop:473 length:288 start_codon:yes stop_codon:yes gene_type:complete